MTDKELEVVRGALSMLNTVAMCRSHECEDCREHAALHRNKLEALIAASQADQPQPGVPEACKLVPLEPTEEMIAAGSASWTHMGPKVKARNVRWMVQEYKAMIAAAPSAPAQQAQQTDLQTVRNKIEAAWCAGYYHRGYTHDSGYAEQESSKFADEVLALEPQQAQQPTTKAIIEAIEYVVDVQGFDVQDEHQGTLVQDVTIATIRHLFGNAAAPVAAQPEQSDDPDNDAAFIQWLNDHQIADWNKWATWGAWCAGRASLAATPPAQEPNLKAIYEAAAKMALLVAGIEDDRLNAQFIEQISKIASAVNAAPAAQQVARNDILEEAAQIADKQPVGNSIAVRIRALKTAGQDERAVEADKTKEGV